jgi:4-nitrophenyl phosphatase
MSATKLSLANLRGLILDMDGVLWEGNTPLPGMPDFFDFMRGRGIRCLLATNNASLTPERYVEKIRRMGVSIGTEEVLTSAMATAEYLKTVAKPGDRAFVIGEEGLIRAVSSAGLEVAGPEELDAQFVVCGMDRGLSWEKLAAATININHGARFIGTNPDVTFPTERGIAHGNGAVLAALTTASGVKPKIIGKPYPALLRMAVKKMDLPKSKIAAVGDRLETDILGARNAGLKSVLLLTGVTRRRDLRKSRIRPTWIFKDLPALQRSWSTAVQRSRG